jgi:hypothetical protein
VTSLRFGERHTGEQTPDLGGIVVLHRRLEMLASGHGLLQLAAQPAPKTHLRRAVQPGSLIASESRSTATEPPSSRITITPTAAPRSRNS